jgi:hypothetical protein
MFVFYQDGAKNNPCDPLTIRIQDFTILIEGEPEGWGALDGIDIWGVVKDEWSPEISYFNAIIERVDFIGEEQEFAYWGMNGLDAYVFGGHIYRDPIAPWNVLNGMVEGTFIVRDCSFEHFAEAVACAGHFVNSKIVIEHNELTDHWYGIQLVDASNSYMKITRNTAVEMRSWAVWIDQGKDHYWSGDSLGVPAPELSTFVISCNDFSGILQDGSDMIMMQDWAYAMGAPPSLKAYVLFNTIYLDNAGGTAIWGSWLHDAVIMGNKISGTGFMGICLGLWADKPVIWWGALNADDSSGSKILFNDVSELECVATPWYSANFGYDPEIDPAARIWLGPLTSDNLVVHFGDVTDVHDVSGLNDVHVF